MPYGSLRVPRIVPFSLVCRKPEYLPPLQNQMRRLLAPTEGLKVGRQGM